MSHIARAASRHRTFVVGTSTLLLAATGAVASAQTAWVKVKASTTDALVRAVSTAVRTGTPTTIVVAPGRYTFVRSYDTAVGPSLVPPVNTTVFVVGTDARTTILDGSGADGRIFTVTRGGYLVVRKLTLTLAGFTADDRSLGGGAAASFGGFLRIDDSVFTTNGTGAPNGAMGGAILSSDGRLHLERVTVADNVVDGYGGGVAFIGGSGIIRGSIIRANAARTLDGAGHGGGIYVDGATVTIAGSTVSGNIAERRGGGIASFGTTWITDSAITRNVGRTDSGGRGTDGGGILNGGSMRIRNGTVGENSAGKFGGGAFNQGHLILEGVTIAGNTVRGDLYPCEPEVAPCAGGGGVWNAEGATISATRTAIADNVIPAYDDPVFAISVGPDCAGRLSSLGHNALGEASGCVLRPSYLLHGLPTHDQVGVVPLLGELSDDGDAGHAFFPLLARSPLVDAGGAFPEACTKSDQVGQPRVDGDADGTRECDIGAIEYQRP